MALLLAALGMPACQPPPGQRPVARVNGRVITVAQLVQVLPGWTLKTGTPGADSATTRDRLEDLLVQELFAQEAERRGLEEFIEYHYELARKKYLLKELYEHVSAPGRVITPAALDSAYEDLTPELRLRVIEVETESIARRLERELARGEPFESLAVRWSVLPNAPAGGSVGWTPVVWFAPPVRAAVRKLSPGEHTPAVPVRDRWQFVKVEEEREPDPPPPPLDEMRGMLTVRLRQARQQALADEYEARLRRRLVYLPEGMAVATKPLESITPAEMEAPVAIRDGEKYVKVARLMHILRRFTPALDTAMRRYTIERELKEDLMYEEALDLGLDRLPSVRDSLAAYRRGLLHQALHRQAVLDSVEVGEDELRAWYEKQSEEFPGASFAAVAPHIEARLLADRRAEARQALAERLRARANIRIDKEVLRGIRQNPDGSWQWP